MISQNKVKMAKILIIEDEKILGEMYKDKLENSGHQVFLTMTAKEGLEIAKKEKPDLIILDILLPGENGVSFLKWIKKELELSKIPVVVLSNYDGLSTKKEAFELGVKDYFLKTDLTPEQLVRKIERYLKN